MPLLRFSSDDLPPLMELAEKMKMGGNKGKTMLQLVDEICRIRNIKAREFLTEEDICYMDLLELEKHLSLKPLQENANSIYAI